MTKGKTKEQELAYHRNKDDHKTLGVNLQKIEIQKKQHLFHADYYEMLEGISFETKDFSKIKLKCYGIGRYSTKYTCE